MTLPKTDLEGAILDQIILVMNRVTPKVSQGDLAEHAGVSRESISNYLNGKRAMPLGVLVAICERLGVSMTDLVNRAYSQLGQ